MKQEIVWWRL